MEFATRSPKLYMEPPFLPNRNHYRTLGMTANNERNLTLAGCHFPKIDESVNMLSIDIEVDGVECVLFPRSMKSYSDTWRGSDGRTASEICPDEGDSLKSVTCEVSERNGYRKNIMATSTT